MKAKTVNATRRPRSKTQRRTVIDRPDTWAEELLRCANVARALAEILEDLREDAEDLSAARAALKEPGRRIPWAELKKTLARD
jgi:hypothetical protein